MTTAKHTALPWKVERDGQDGNLYIRWQGEWIAKLNDFMPDEANARLIVRAVNSHQALVEALETILDVWEGGGEVVDEHEQMVRAALKLAKEKDNG